jgi:hypothetical protein
MEYLSTTPRFNTLSLSDLLHARDQFHAHLMHKANVVGTAVGRYLIRKSDPYPKGPNDDGKKHRGARTLENSEVRPYSWPAVLVFVSRWREEKEFGGSDLETTDFVPKTIYLEDGRSVPVCVVEAPPIERAPAPLDPADLQFPSRHISGGYPVIARPQNGMHLGSLGCLVTDGHLLYALTSRHVAGRTGEQLATILDGEEVVIGKTSSKQLGRRPFEHLYDGWPGKHIAVNLDVGLIEIDDQSRWSPAIFGIGMLGPLADLSTYNISVDLIGCPVLAHGCASTLMRGQISALFYRYQSVGGLEYVADFLIGARGDDDEPLATHPGDSGTVWVLETNDADRDRRPIAVQWGGAVFSSEGARMPFALATNLSSVCRELEIDVVRARDIATFEYWGAVGHYTIGSFACDLLSDPDLKDLFGKNRDRISFDPSNLGTNVNSVTDAAFVPLADVPDKVWKKRKEDVPYGRKGPENPNHYADLDFPGPDGKTLGDLTKTQKDLKPDVWRAYYKSVGWNAVSARGLLPFRVWQLYDAMVAFVAAKDVTSYVAAAGVLAHYVGDACQPLHGSYLDDGDPFRERDGTKVAEPLAHGKGYGGGVHVAYEDTMIDAKVDTILLNLPKALKVPPDHGMELVEHGQAAGFAVVELMRRTRATIAPIDIVEAYGELEHPIARAKASATLWKRFGKDTIRVLADGCRTLAMLWESAWVQGKGASIAKSSLKAVSRAKLKTLYEDQTFVPSKPLGQIDGELET